MPKPSPSNSMPWPENLIYDFQLSPSTTPSAAEAFIASLSTSDKNKEFLRLRYKERMQYSDIAPKYGISAGGVRQAVKYVIGRYIASAPSASTNTESSVENHTSTGQSGSPATNQSAKEGVLIVDPAALNGIALIETIRILYRRVGAENFEEALDELRDVLCSISAVVSEGQ